MNDIDKIKNDFRLFLFVVWKHLSLPDPTPIQYDVADFLQGSFKRGVVQGFRGMGKSWVTSAYVCWRLLNDPQMNILVVSASKERADAFSTFTKRLIHEMPLLQHLKPKASQRDSNIAFDVGPARASHAPSVKSVGITGQITGSRADLIIADDVESYNNSATQIQRDQLKERVKEFEAVLKPTEDARVLFLGTPQTALSIYNDLENRGYMTRIWPARYPDESLMTHYGSRIAPIVLRKSEDGTGVAGRTTDPLRFSDEDLIERELSYGRSGFALQFMLDTSQSDENRYPLKMSDLIVYNLDTEMAPSKFMWARKNDLVISDLPTLGLNTDRYYRASYVSDKALPYEYKIMVVDPAGRGTDETAYAVLGTLNGQIFLLDIGGYMEGYSEATLDALANTAKHYDVKNIIVESNFGDGMFSALFNPILQKKHQCGLEEIRHNIQKEKRIIDTLEPVLNQHRLIVDEEVIRKDFNNLPEDIEASTKQYYSLFYQLTHLTSDRSSLSHDDRLDALAIGVGFLMNSMSRDVSEAAIEAETRQWEEEMNKNLAEMLGIDKSDYGGSVWNEI